MMISPKRTCPIVCGDFNCLVGWKRTFHGDENDAVRDDFEEECERGTEFRHMLNANYLKISNGQLYTYYSEAAATRVDYICVLKNLEVLKSMPLIEAARRLQLYKDLQVRDHVPVLCVLKYKHAFERIKRVAPLYDARAMVEAWQSGSQSFSAFRARCAK